MRLVFIDWSEWGFSEVNLSDFIGWIIVFLDMHVISSSINISVVVVTENNCDSSIDLSISNWDIISIWLHSIDSWLLWAIEASKQVIRETSNNLKLLLDQGKIRVLNIAVYLDMAFDIEADLAVSRH